MSRWILKVEFFAGLCSVLGNTVWVKESFIKGLKWNELMFWFLVVSGIFTMLQK